MEKNEFYVEGVRRLIKELQALAIDILRMGTQLVIPLLYIKHIGKEHEYKEFEKQIMEKYKNGSPRHN